MRIRDKGNGCSKEEKLIRGLVFAFLFALRLDMAIAGPVPQLHPSFSSLLRKSNEGQICNIRLVDQCGR